MSLDTLNNGDSGLEARTKINAAIAAIEGSSALPRKHLCGFNMVYHTMGYLETGPGSCRDDTNSADIVLPASIIKVFGSSFAAGDSNGGMQTGLNAAVSTNYSVWVIRDTVNNVTDVMYSTSATAPTLPGTFNVKRRIAWVRTLPFSTDIVQFIQFGDQMFIGSGSSSADMSVSVTNTNMVLVIPSPPNVVAELRCYGSGAGGWYLQIESLMTFAVSAASPDLASLAGTSTVPSAGRFNIPTTESSQIIARSGAVTCNLKLSVRGWTDSRGRND